MIESLLPIVLIANFGVNLVAEASSKWIATKWRTAGVTNHDLQKALRESYCDALSSIEFGFHRQEGLLDSLGKRRLYREITSNFDKEFLTPFISQTSLGEDELQNLTREGATYCRILREAVDQLLPKDDIPTITIEDLLLAGRKLEGAEDLRKLNNKAKADLMAKVRSLEGIPKFFFDFLEYKDLLIGSLVFFYGEKIKTNERVRSIFTHAELQRIREEQSQQYQKQAAKLEKALQSQTSAFQQFLSPIKDNFAEVLTCLDRLEAEWADTTKYLQRILDLITVDKGLSPKDKKQLEAGLSPSFDLHAKYEFDERKPIGYGAVATVYRAMHRGLRQVRAVKVLKPEHRENQELVERFLREAVVLGSLKHPNIVQIYDAGGGGPNLDFYLEMEYVEGVTLRNFIKTHDFDWERNLKFIKQLGSAVQKMHDSGIIHRDLNPRNIMVAKNGDLKVMDFGVAKIIGVEGLTKDGQVVGSTDYMAPEQARGERVDERADIYSFGIILYELCTRRLPSVPLVHVHQYQPDVPEWLEGIVDKCLKRDRNLRYSSMDELLVAIEKQESEVLKKVEIKEEPVLLVAPERLGFSDIRVGSRATRSFIVRNIGTGKLIGSITASQPWLKVSQDTIDLLDGNRKVLVTVNTAGLAFGFKGTADINIVTNGGTARITVSLSLLTATKPGRIKRRLFPAIVAVIGIIGILFVIDKSPLCSRPPILNVDDSPLYFTDLKPAVDSENKMLLISNTGGGTLQCNLDSDKNWLHINPNELKVDAGEEKGAQIYVSTSGLPYGLSDTGYITVKDTNGISRRIAVNLTMTKIILSDDFSDPNSGWDVGPSKGGEADSKYQDGGFRIIVKKDDSCWWNYDDKVGQLGDFVIEVDAKWMSQLNSSQGVYGIAFRNPDSANSYMFWVNNSDQSYVIWKQLNGSVSALQDWTHSDYISRGTAPNRLKIICQGAKISAYVNSGYLSTVTDYSFSKGYAGMLVGKFKGALLDADALFDNLKIYVPD
jgi:tRNA A-37 threonylcarbamoyl transferase component Bud32